MQTVTVKIDRRHAERWAGAETLTIEQEMVSFDIRRERTPNSHNTGRHVLWQGNVRLGEFDAHEAVELLKTLRQMDDAPQRIVGHYGPMCRDPSACAGKGYCPRDPNCAD